MHIIQRSIRFHHNWLGEYINMPTFFLLSSSQILLHHSVLVPGNRTARFPIDWPGGREEKRERRGWGHKKRRLQMPIYSPLIAIHEFLFPKRIFRNQRPPSLWRRRGLHPIQWQSAAMSYGNITAQCSINMSPSSRNRRRRRRGRSRDSDHWLCAWEAARGWCVRCMQQADEYRDTDCLRSMKFHLKDARNIPEASNIV